MPSVKHKAAGPSQGHESSIVFVKRPLFIRHFGTFAPSFRHHHHQRLRNGSAMPIEIFHTVLNLAESESVHHKFQYHDWSSNFGAFNVLISPLCAKTGTVEHDPNSETYSWKKRGGIKQMALFICGLRKLGKKDLLGKHEACLINDGAV